MVPETLMERPLWIGSVEETESERRLFQQNRPEAVTRGFFGVMCGIELPKPPPFTEDL